MIQLPEVIKCAIIYDPVDEIDDRGDGIVDTGDCPTIE